MVGKKFAVRFSSLFRRKGAGSCYFSHTENVKFHEISCSITRRSQGERPDPLQHGFSGHRGLRDRPRGRPGAPRPGRAGEGLLHGDEAVQPGISYIA